MVQVAPCSKPICEGLEEQASEQVNEEEKASEQVDEEEHKKQGEEEE